MNAFLGRSPAALLHAQPRGRLRIFHLEPRLNLAASIRRVDALRDDAFQSHPAGVLENVSAVAAEVFAVADAGPRFAQQLGQSRLAVGERLAAHVGAVEREQIERIGVGAGIVDARHQPFEVGDAALAVAAAFGVDDGVADVEPRDVLDDPRIAFGPIDAGHGVEADAPAAGVDLQTEAVVLDFVDPAVGGRRTLGAARQAGINEGSRRKRGPLAGTLVTPRDHNGAAYSQTEASAPEEAEACLGAAPWVRMAALRQSKCNAARAVPKAKPRLRWSRGSGLGTLVRTGGGPFDLEQRDAAALPFQKRSPGW